MTAYLDGNFFRIRFDRLAPWQQKYLRAMAELGPGPYKTGEIAAAFGVGATSVATVRQQPVKKGMESAARGDGVHRADVRPLHAALDAEAGEACARPTREEATAPAKEKAGARHTKRQRPPGMVR